MVGIFSVQDWVLSPDAIYPTALGSEQIRDTILCIVSHCFWKRELELFGKLLLLAHGEGVGAFPIPFSGLRHIWKGRDFTSCIIIIWKQGLDLRFRAFLFKTLLSNPPSPPPPPVPRAPSHVLFAPMLLDRWKFLAIRGQGTINLQQINLTWSLLFFLRK